MAEARRRAKLAEWLTTFYEWHFPRLVEFRDLDAEESYVDQPPGEDGHDDPARHWLTAEEFAVESLRRSLERRYAVR